MIIMCKEKRFIYIPQSKVANTSILTAIATSTGHPCQQDLKHKMLVDLDWDYVSYKQLLESNFFKFGFIRNPWDRLVSCYNDKIFSWKSTRSESPHFKISTNLSFEQFVVWMVSLSKDDRYYDDPHFMPQYTALYNDDRLLVDFIGRFERLRDDWRSINLRFGLGKLPLINARKHLHYSTYYNKKLRTIVDKFYERDIELFGYKFEKQ